MHEQSSDHDESTAVKQTKLPTNYVDVLNGYVRYSSKRKRRFTHISQGNSHRDTAERLQTSTINQQKFAQNPQNPAKTLHLPTASHLEDSDLISLLDEQISSITRQIAQTTDPVKIEQLSEVVTLLRRQRKNEKSARRLRFRHLEDRLKHSSRKKKIEVDHITDQLDPLTIFTALQKLIDQHPNMARLTAKQMRIDNLSEGMSILQQIVNNPERKRQLVEFVTNGLIEVVRGVITKFELGNSTSVKSQETVPPQPAPEARQQPPLYNIGGHLIDPTKPYPVL